VPDLFLQIDDEDASESPVVELTDAEAIEILRTGEIVGSKLIPWGSNYSFASAVEAPDGREAVAIYKPMRGENPLWDFPDGTLYLREVAAYRLTEMLGWPIIPPTVIHEGSMGPGSLQLYKAPREQTEDEAADPRNFWGEKTVAIEQLVLFDHIANNADRKLSHCLVDKDGHVWGIDHGLCFNVDFKLRTVLWQFVGCPVSDELIASLIDLRMREDQFREQLQPLLNESELVALLHRIDAFIVEPIFPILNPGRNIPYGWW
jgi:uncharacterized repeat protein (TIGR03843 family)